MSEATVNPLIGHKIINVRPMAESEKELAGFVKDEYEDRECCADGVAVLVLSNGARVFALSDPEGNDGGHLVAALKGEMYDIFA